MNAQKLKKLILGIVYIVFSNLVYQAVATVAFTVILLIFLYDESMEDSIFPIKGMHLSSMT